MRKRLKTHGLFLIFLLLLVAVCGTVLAYMFKKTSIADNQFTPANVSCVVREVTDASVTEKTSIKVENTGNIDAYLRVRLVSYWVQKTGETTEIVAKASQMPTFTTAEGWLKGSNDTYYYTKPIAPGALTPELLSTKITLTEEDGYLQVVEVFAEAIQSVPTSAVTGSWQVTLDTAGTITSVK